MKKKIILASLILSVCGGIYAVTKQTRSTKELCDMCQPHSTADCVTYIIENTGNAGIWYCGKGVNIYDSTPED